MHLLLSPGVSLMRRLSFPQRLGAFALGLLALLGVVGYSVRELSHNLLDFAVHERIGVRLLEPAGELLFVAHGLSEARITGDAEAAAAALERARKLFREIGQAADDWVAQLATGQLVVVGQALESGDDETLRAATARLVADIVDSSHLILDPELDSYYLMDAGLLRAPRALALAHVVAHEADGDPIARAGNLALLRAVAGDLVTSLETSIRHNPALEERIRPLADQVRAAAGANGIEQGPQAGTTLRSALAAVHTGALEELDALLGARIDRLGVKVASIIGATILAVLLVAYLALAFQAALMRSVGIIGTMAEAMAKGDLAPSPLDADPDALSVAIRRLAGARQQLAGIIGEAIRLMDPVTTGARTVGETSRTSAKALERQQHETDQIASAVSQMAAAGSEIARGAAHAAEAATRAVDEATAVRDVLSASIAASESLAHEVVGAAESIRNLERETQQITSVVDVIRGIADQTNLLALNAAIEAARAGDNGRGFAVVADEVRNFSLRTQTSTSEIDQMIARLRTGAIAAVSVMDSSQQRAQAAADHSAHATEALGRVTGAVSHMNDLNHQIAAAAEEQSTVISTLESNITAVRDIGARTSSAVTAMAENMRELGDLAAGMQQKMACLRFG